MFNRFYTTQRFKSQILGKKNGNRGVLPYKIKKGILRFALYRKKRDLQYKE